MKNPFSFFADRYTKTRQDFLNQAAVEAAISGEMEKLAKLKDRGADLDREGKVLETLMFKGIYAFVEEAIDVLGLSPASVPKDSLHKALCDEETWACGALVQARCKKMEREEAPRPFRFVIRPLPWRRPS